MNYLMIDTETCNTIDDPFCYDIGFAVINDLGEVLEKHSYVVADLFLDKELMATAYFAEKIPQYWDDIKSGKRTLRRLRTIRFIIKDICAQYNIKIAVAHNASFDNRSLNYTQRYTTSSKYRWFLPFNVEWWDTLKMSREVLKDDEAYNTFCKENDYLTKNGQNRYTAEIIYRFLTNDNDFVESHTGLEDVLIEKEIFMYCMEKNPQINGKLWA